MKKILLSAFSCDPFKGSESACGWNWATLLAQKGYEVHCLTRSVNRQGIESHPPVPGLSFHYLSLPLGFEGLYALSQVTMYLYYLLWQLLAYVVARKLHRKICFDLIQHVSWGNMQLGSFLYKLPIPLIFGPTGGGQVAPPILKEYFLKSWEVEQRREKISRLLFSFNPACFKMIKKAKVIIASNPDSLEMAKSGGAKHTCFSLDAALQTKFYPPSFCEKVRVPGHLKMLWVGRLMPRKGLLLVLDVMKELCSFPNITLTIVGDGEMRGDIEERIKKHDLKNNAHMTGAVSYEDVRSFYASHEVFFFTSLRDSCPCQLIEAMAFGLPVITLDLHGQAVIVSEKTGVRVPVDQPQTVVKELVKAVVELSQDTERYSLMSRAAYEFARQQTWERKVEDITAKFYN